MSVETNCPKPDGAGEDLLSYLEQLWGLPAKPPAHDPQRNGWLIAAWVFGLIACGSALGAIASASVAPLLPAAASAFGSALAVVLHRHVRRRRTA